MDIFIKTYCLTTTDFDNFAMELIDIQKLYSAAEYSKKHFIGFNYRTQILSEANFLNCNFKKLIEKIPI